MTARKASKRPGRKRSEFVGQANELGTVLANLRTAKARARFWAEAREGQREAEARSRP